MRLLIINGPNLNNIGTREPKIYGNVSFSSFLLELSTYFPNISFDYFHSHLESEIVNKIHESTIDNIQGIILNAGAYSHSSVAIRDAIAAIDAPVVMVHISNIYSREQFRHKNIVAEECKGVITGFGLQSYSLAVSSFIK